MKKQNNNVAKVEATMARFTPPKSPIVYDKHHSGCMWGLYSLFEFRHGNSNRKMISDKKRFKRDIVDDGNVENRVSVIELDGNSKSRGKDEKSENSAEPNRPNEKKKLESKDSSKSKRLSHQNPVGKSLEELEKKKRVKTKRGCGCKNVDFVRYDEFLKANDVAEAIVNQKLIEGKYLTRDGVNQHSKQLLDALEILNSNKDLFTKLLQDPNSLLVKHIQDLRESQELKNRAKTIECNDPEPSEIVVLKPGSMSKLKSSGKIDGRFEDQRVNFSFGDIKRKFRNAVGATRKDQNLTIIDNVTQKSSKEVRMSLFDVDKRDKIEKLREFKARIGQENASTSEACNRRNELRFSNNLSQMRFSPFSYSEEPYDRWKLTREQKDRYANSLKQNIEDLIHSKKSYTQSQVVYKDFSFRGLDSEVDEIAKNPNKAEEISSPKGLEKAISSDQTIIEEIEDFECSRMDSSVDDQPLTSSSVSTPLSIRRSDGCDVSKDLGESSPISVLEQIFTDVASPLISETNQSSISSPQSNAIDTISEYVKTVLRASSLNSSNLNLKSRDSDQMLKAVASQPNQFCGDCKLLFDCVSQTLVEIHNTHLSPFPWLSFVTKRSIVVPLEAEKFVAREAMKRIGCYFKAESTQPSLDQLIGEDLDRSGAWLDLRIDGENVVDEIAEFALEELIMETIVDLYVLS